MKVHISAQNITYKSRSHAKVRLRAVLQTQGHGPSFSSKQYGFCGSTAPICRPITVPADIMSSFMLSIYHKPIFGRPQLIGQAHLQYPQAAGAVSAQASQSGRPTANLTVTYQQVCSLTGVSVSYQAAETLPQLPPQPAGPVCTAGGQAQAPAQSPVLAPAPVSPPEVYIAAPPTRVLSQ